MTDGFEFDEQAMDYVPNEVRTLRDALAQVTTQRDAEREENAILAALVQDMAVWLTENVVSWPGAEGGALVVLLERARVLVEPRDAAEGDSNG